MKKDIAMKAIGYAVLFNSIVLFIPLVLELTLILQTPRLNPSTEVNSVLSQTAGKLLCYTTLGCPSKLAYIIFPLELIFFSGIVYFISLRKAYSIAERKQLLIWFIIAFPSANYLMVYYFIVAVFFIIGVIKFGFV